MKALEFIVIGLLILIGISFGVFIIVLNIKYANVPLSELPTWVAWFLFGGRK